MDMFRAVMQGYSDRLFDLQLLGVQQGYWSGYYGRAKKPKQPSGILRKMYRERQHSAKPGKRNVPDVDVEAFKATEQQFWSRMKLVPKE